MELPEGFALACVMEREDPRDALVSNAIRRRWTTCRKGAVVGTSSLRRVVLLRALRPDLKIEAACAATSTRACASWTTASTTPSCWRRPASSGWACASASASCSSPTQMLPAAGQGALGIEVRADRADLLGVAGAAGAPGDLAGGCGRTRGEPRHGRQLLDAAGGARDIFDGEYLQLRAAWGDPDRPRPLVRAQGRPPWWPTWRRPADWGLPWPRGCAPPAPTETLRHAGDRHPSGKPRPRAGSRTCARAVSMPVALPLIAIVPVPQPQALQAAWGQLDRYRAVMFVSGNAVRAFLRAPARDHLLARPYPCLGARAGDRRCAGRGRCSPRRSWMRLRREPRSSIRKHCGSGWQAKLGAGDRVLIVRGEEADGRGQGRDWLAQQLGAAGVEVQAVAAYLRAAACVQPGAARMRPSWRDPRGRLAVQQFARHSQPARPAARRRTGRRPGRWRRTRASRRRRGWRASVLLCESRPSLDDVVAALESFR